VLFNHRALTRHCHQEMGRTPPVSVIMTAYNEAAILEVVVSRLGMQTFAHPWELLVCDDGSDQEVLPILKRTLPGRNPAVRYIWQARDGARRAKSRNNALRCATGEVVILLDGDVAVGSDFIEQHVAGHQGGGRTAVYGSRKWLFLKDLAAGTSLAECVAMHLSDTGAADRLFSDTQFQREAYTAGRSWLGCMGCNFSFSRTDPVFFNEHFVGWGVEDQEFACRLERRHAYRLIYEPAIWGLHLEDEFQRNHTPIRPRSHDEIMGYFRNISLLWSLYPDIEMPEADNVLAWFEFDHESARWRRAAQPDFRPANIRMLRDRVRTLFEDPQKRIHPHTLSAWSGAVKAFICHKKKPG
jgi:glycosyltransferase involved in cell wall biosynthesis